MAISADFSIATNGDIRYTGTGTNYTVIAFHRWLGDLMDDAAATGDDLLDITSSTASERATDNYITLNSPYNIDDIAAQHLYDGSIVQGAGGTDIYDGILVYAAAGTYLQVVQNGNMASPNFWTTGLNADATNGISHRFMLKTRSGGLDIDGRRLIGQTREFGYTYSQFPINGTSRGNNVMAVTYATDLNNTTVEATVRGYTGITNTEGYRAIDVDNNAVNEYYYSEWLRSTYTINQLFERMKWLSKRAVVESSNADTGTNYTVGDGTTTGRGQSFANGTTAKYLTNVHFKLKKVGTPTGNLVAKLYTHTGTFGSSGTPTGAALATSVNLDVSKLTTALADIEIAFTTQYLMAASTNYYIAVEYTGDVSNYVHVEGAATGTHAGNLASNTGTWAATAGADLWFAANASPQLYGISGELFRGVTHEVNLTTPRAGTFSATEKVVWGTPLSGVVIADTAGGFTCTAGTIAVGQLLKISGTLGGTGSITGYANPTTYKVSVTNGTTSFTLTTEAGAAMATTTGTPTGLTYNLLTGVGVMLATDSVTTGTKMWIQLMTGVAPAASVLISGVTSGATSTDSGAPTERTLSFPFCGASTGSAIIGSYGFGVAAASLSAADKVFDLTNTQKTPPNYVTYTVSGLVASEDYVLVGQKDAGNAIKYNQFTLNGALTGATVTAVVVNTAIPSDTPATGTIRVKRNSGIYSRLVYTSWAGSTFTIGSTDFSTDNASNANNVFISYIDVLASGATAAFTSVYSADRDLYIRVRDGGATPIKTYESPGVLASAGGSASAIRTSDA